MDRTKEETGKRDWKWLPEFMPRAAALIREKKAEHGAEWVATCWQKGVIEGRPGWFWAAQGPLCVGVPANAQLVNDWYAMRAKYPHMPDMAMIIIPSPDNAPVEA